MLHKITIALVTTTCGQLWRTPTTQKPWTEDTDQKNQHELMGCSGELVWEMLCSPLTVVIHSAQEEKMLKPTQHCSWEVSLTGLKSTCWVTQTSSVSTSLIHRVGDSRVGSSPATTEGFIQLTQIAPLFKILNFLLFYLRTCLQTNPPKHKILALSCACGTAAFGAHWNNHRRNPDDAAEYS